MPGKDANSAIIKLGQYIIDKLKSGQLEFGKQEMMEALGIKNEQTLMKSLDNGYRDLFNYKTKDSIVKPNLQLFSDSLDPQKEFLKELNAMISIHESPVKGKGIDRLG